MLSACAEAGMAKSNATMKTPGNDQDFIVTSP
jgi:hypothetical protein